MLKEQLAQQATKIIEQAKTIEELKQSGALALTEVHICPIFRMFER